MFVIVLILLNFVSWFVLWMFVWDVWLGDVDLLLVLLMCCLIKWGIEDNLRNIKWIKVFIVWFLIWLGLGGK